MHSWKRWGRRWRFCGLLLLFSWDKLSIFGSVAVWEGRGRHWDGFKLLSVSVTPYYLDSNYTCQLSLGPHLSLRLKPHALHSSVFDKPCAHSLPVLYSCVTFLGVSQYYDRVDSLPPLPLCIHCRSNPLCFVLPYSWRTQRFNSHQISNMVAEMATWNRHRCCVVITWLTICHGVIDLAARSIHIYIFLTDDGRMDLGCDGLNPINLTQTWLPIAPHGW